MDTYRVQYGGKDGTTYTLQESNDLLVVRTRSRNFVFETTPGTGAPLSDEALAVLTRFELEEEYFNAGVTVLRTRSARNARSIRDRAGHPESRG